MYQCIQCYVSPKPFLELTVALIQVWEEIPHYTNCWLIRSMPRCLGIHTGTWGRHTLLSHLVTDEIHTPGCRSLLKVRLQSYLYLFSSLPFTFSPLSKFPLFTYISRRTTLLLIATHSQYNTFFHDLAPFSPSILAQRHLRSSYWGQGKYFSLLSSLMPSLTKSGFKPGILGAKAPLSSLIHSWQASPSVACI